MSADLIIVLVMATFSVLGGIDRMTGNSLGLGKTFENGILTVGQLMLSMTGIIVLCPVVANVLEPVVVPVYRLLGADPAIFAGSLFACDMGGAQLAIQLAGDRSAGLLGGIIVASMLGVTVSFTIPVAMSVLKQEDRPFAAKGILCGIFTIPAGILTGGLAAGYPTQMIIRNIIPVILLVVFIALGLWKAERFLIRVFELFAKGLILLATIGLVAGGVELTTGILLIPGLGSVEEAFLIVGEIGIVLSGAFPLMHCVTKLLKKPLAWTGRQIGVNEQSVSGLVTTLANSIATFDMIGEMDVRGKIINMAFCVSGAFVLGDHLAFTAGFAPSMITAMVIGKLSAGILAIVLACWVTRKKR